MMSLAVLGLALLPLQPYIATAGADDRHGADRVYLAGMLMFPALPAILRFGINAGVLSWLAEIGLVLLLFTDASRTDTTVLRCIGNLAVRLLSVGMLLTILFGAVAARLVFPHLSNWEAGILASILAPTDAGLGQIVVNSSRVPMRRARRWGDRPRWRVAAGSRAPQGVDGRIVPTNRRGRAAAALLSGLRIARREYVHRGFRRRPCGADRIQGSWQAQCRVCRGMGTIVQFLCVLPFLAWWACAVGRSLTWNWRCMRFSA